MEKVVFHKGDFYIEREHNGKGWSSPIIPGGGETEYYFHLMRTIEVIEEDLKNYGKMKFITREMSMVKNSLKSLRNKVGQVKIGRTKFKIKNVKRCSCYDKVKNYEENFPKS